MAFYILYIILTRPIDDLSKHNLWAVQLCDNPLVIPADKATSNGGRERPCHFLLDINGLFIPQHHNTPALPSACKACRILSLPPQRSLAALLSKESSLVS